MVSQAWAGGTHFDLEVGGSRAKAEPTKGKVAQPGYHRERLWWHLSDQKLQNGQGQGWRLPRAGLEGEQELASGSQPLRGSRKTLCLIGNSDCRAWRKVKQSQPGTIERVALGVLSDFSGL